jgi:uncharacterized protein
MLEFLKQPWHWSIAGLLIGLTVPVLLLMGNKPFGLSSNLRHICAICMPSKLPFFNYDWKKDVWNLYFAVGIVLGGFIGSSLIENTENIRLSAETIQDLRQFGLSNFSGLVPQEIFAIDALFTAKGLIFIILGGFLVGFGTRYASGCTSGHAIFGLSTLQWPSLVATICFFASGIITTLFVFPFLSKLF